MYKVLDKPGESYQKIKPKYNTTTTSSLPASHRIHPPMPANTKETHLYV